MCDLVKKQKMELSLVLEEVKRLQDLKYGYQWSQIELHEETKKLKKQLKAMELEQKDFIDSKSKEPEFKTISQRETALKKFLSEDKTYQEILNKVEELEKETKILELNLSKARREVKYKTMEFNMLMKFVDYELKPTIEFKEATIENTDIIEVEHECPF